VIVYTFMFSAGSPLYHKVNFGSSTFTLNKLPKETFTKNRTDKNEGKMAKTYNINELLEKKKELEKQVEQKGEVTAKELVYEKQVRTDYTNKDNTSEFEARKKVSLEEYSKEFNSIVQELSRVKTAIQKHNAVTVVERLQERDCVRRQIRFLNNVKTNLHKEKQQNRQVTRQDAEGRTLEIADISIEPMFPLEDVESQLNSLSSRERKLNTEIQRLNLEAEISLS